MAKLGKLMAEALKLQLQTRAPVMVPAGGDLLWSWFADLNRTREIGQVGALPIRWAEYHAYAALRSFRLDAHHIDVLLAMDTAYLEFVNARLHAPEGVKTMQPTSSRAITTDLFDAMFG